MKHELKPCPFCGSDATLNSERISEDSAVAFARCKKCCASTDYFEDAYAPTADAADAWNSRIGDVA